MKITKYAQQEQEDGSFKTVRVVRTFPDSVGVDTAPIKTEVLPLETVYVNGSSIIVS